ncbi:MAG: FAD/NAD(P)-binding protein [Planctomycetaceae bacterium]|nr:FAD/NAD(P)-binding protein [Planctomycetaceae bacterium]
MTVSAPFPSVNRLDPWKAHSAKICAVFEEVPGIKTYELELEPAGVRDEYRFQPGQFNMVYLPGFGESAISISSDPGSPGRLLHTVRAVGNVTNALARKQTGDQILLRGPFGSWWPLENCIGQDLIIACGGVGLPPLRPVIYEIVRRRKEFGDVSILYGARRPEDLLFTNEYESWRKAGIQLEVTVDLGNLGWTGHIGVVPTLFERLDVSPAQTSVFTCGPEIMMRFVIQEAQDRGIASERIFLSMERNMNCALGLCGHCQLGPEFICKDGPVFSFDRMEPYFHMEDF